MCLKVALSRQNESDMKRKTSRMLTKDDQCSGYYDTAFLLQEVLLTLLIWNIFKSVAFHSCGVFITLHRA